MKYGKRVKASAMRKVLPPESRSVPEVAREMAVSEQTIYNWKRMAEFLCHRNRL
ncbi:MAG: transposase [Smithellaceae bacterium]